MLDGVRRWVVNPWITGESVVEGNIHKSHDIVVREKKGLVAKHLWEQGDSDVQNIMIDEQRELHGGIADFLQAKAVTQ